MGIDPRLPVEALLAEDRGAILDLVEEAVGVGVFVWSPGQQVRWSRGMFLLLGFDPEQPVSAASFFDRVHPEDRARVVMASQTVITRGVVDEFPYRLVRADGTHDWVTGGGWVERDASGEIARVVGTVVRVTDAHLAAERLAQANALLAETQRAAGVGSYVFHLGSGRMEWSEELYRLLGVDPSTPVDELLAQRLAHPDDVARQLDWGTRVAMGEQLPPLLVRQVRPSDGRTIVVESIARRVERPGGPCVIGVSLDVTTRVALEQELRHAARAESVGLLAAGVAHDFNNYLTVLSAELELIRARGLPPQPDALDAMAGAIARSAALVRQLLAFARKHPYHPVRLDLVAQAQGVIDLFARVAVPAVRVTLAAGAHPSVLGDATQLDGALMNLLVNARDALPAGGEIRVEIGTLELAAGDARLEGRLPPGRYARLAVVDAGVGIAPEHLPHVFEPYYTTKSLDRGSGLGLAAVLGTARQHAGAVRLDSVVDRGTTVELLLPLAPEATAAAAPGAGIGRPLALRVLLVEDQVVVREALARLLASEGHVVVTATDGADALDRVERAGPFDLVISDIEMPELDGLALAQALRAAAPSLPVLLMTGYADHQGDDALAPVLAKPFSLDELNAAIARVRARR